MWDMFENKSDKINGVYTFVTVLVLRVNMGIRILVQYCFIVLHESEIEASEINKIYSVSRFVSFVKI